MTHSNSSSHSILKEIVDRYFEQPYPALARLMPLHFKGDMNAPLNKPLPPVQEKTPVKTIALDIVLENPPPPSDINNEEPKLPPIHERVKKSSWDCIPPHTDLSREEILRTCYPVLQPHILHTPLDIPCRIFVDEEQNEEILFFNRLTKILTQQIFPTRLILHTGRREIFHSTEGFSLSLAPLTMMRYKIPNIRYHQPFTKNGSTWIPIYSSVYYENDPKLKRDLWALLNQQPFAYTQRS
ncbi:hypothetical protein [Chlamydia vaughanii]|uniref:hypothetical protein n=1 Tax=Chlamydia vaughanii TaxID=3112552 RepID=UPI0032B23898